MLACALLATACKKNPAKGKAAASGPERSGIENLAVVHGDGKLAAVVNYLLPQKRRDDSHWLEAYDAGFDKPRWRVVRARFAHLIAAVQREGTVVIAWQDKDAAMIGQRRGAVIEARRASDGKLLWQQELGKRAFVSPYVLASAAPRFVALTRELAKATVAASGHDAADGKQKWRHEVAPTLEPPPPLREAVTLAVGRDLRVMLQAHWLLISTGLGVSIIDTRDGKRSARAGPGPLCRAVAGEAVLARYADGKASGLDLHRFDSKTGTFGKARGVLPAGAAPGRVVRIDGERVVMLALPMRRGRKQLSDKQLGVRGGGRGRGRTTQASGDKKKKARRRGVRLVAYADGKREPVWQLEISSRRSLSFRPDCSRAHQGRYEPFVVARGRQVLLVDLQQGSLRWRSQRAKTLRVGSVARARGAVVLGLVTTPPIAVGIDPAAASADDVTGADNDEPLSRSAPPELLVFDTSRGGARDLTAFALTGATAAEAKLARQLRAGVWYGIVPRLAHETFKRSSAHAQLRWRVDLAHPGQAITEHGGKGAIGPSRKLSAELGKLPAGE
ncbi:MAG: PQQ-binding-like beta-propeller repeat protein [Myxococcales bacterium]|nr:PQQ-binding-like beta-propeller repeat protein [Myxococcales bacterium]